MTFSDAIYEILLINEGGCKVSNLLPEIIQRISSDMISDFPKEDLSEEKITNFLLDCIEKDDTLTLFAYKFYGKNPPSNKGFVCTR